MKHLILHVFSSIVVHKHLSHHHIPQWSILRQDVLLIVRTTAQEMCVQSVKNCSSNGLDDRPLCPLLPKHS